ncbi:Uncharacterized protein ToN1_48200 [Aromatoleum petrolei]|nr:Uncharacterized protein ToN1_48200 [Aromatoleum petrolei]
MSVRGVVRRFMRSGQHKAIITLSPPGARDAADYDVRAPRRACA